MDNSEFKDIPAYTEDEFHTEFTSLGNGGNGSVYTVFCKTKKQRVVVKHPLDNDEWNIFPEASIMFSLKHPHVIELYAIAMLTINGARKQNLVMEYASKGSLTSFVLHGKPHSNNYEIELRPQMMLQMAQAVDYLHKQPLIHCDLHADNIFLNEAYQIKIGDFGQSAAPDENGFVIRIHKMGFSARWRAPETLFTNENNDNEYEAFYSQFSDIYTLGLVFWLLYSKKIPYPDLPTSELCHNEVLSDVYQNLTCIRNRAVKNLVASMWTTPDRFRERPTAAKVWEVLKNSFQNHHAAIPISTRKP